MEQLQQQVRVVMTSAGYYTFKNVYLSPSEGVRYMSNEVRLPVDEDIHGLRRQVEDMLKALDMPVLEDIAGEPR